LGRKLKDFGALPPLAQPGTYYIKAPVFPWGRFDMNDVLLGPEMHSTGEVMGIGSSFGEAYAKALSAASQALPNEGGVFISLCDRDKHMLSDLAGPLHAMGFQLWATRGTATALEQAGIPCETVFKVKEGRPDIVDHVRNGKIQLMINTPSGKKSVYDERAMRLAGLRFGVPCITTMRAAMSAVSAIRSQRAGELKVVKLQQLHSSPNS
jgi:carbamoyl-phosphate synthase large subunit